MWVSTLFILYVLTGADIVDAPDVYWLFKLKHPEVIVWFAWLLFFWYWYRFRLSLRGDQTFTAEKQNLLTESRFLREAAKQELNRDLEDQEKVQDIRGVRLIETTAGKHLLKWDKAFRKGKQADSLPNHVDISGLKWHFLQIRHTLHVALILSPAF